MQNPSNFVFGNLKSLCDKVMNSKAEGLAYDSLAFPCDATKSICESADAWSKAIFTVCSIDSIEIKMRAFSQNT